MSRGCCSISASSCNFRWCVTFAKTSSSVACTQHRLNANDAITTPIVRFIFSCSFKRSLQKNTSDGEKKLKKTNKHNFTYRSHGTRYNENVSFTINHFLIQRAASAPNPSNFWSMHTSASVSFQFATAALWLNQPFSKLTARRTDSDVEKVKVFLFKSKMRCIRLSYPQYITKLCIKTNRGWQQQLTSVITGEDHHRWRI